MIKTGKYQAWKGTEGMLYNYKIGEGNWVDIMWVHYVCLKFMGYIVRVNK